jgi:rod shape-determining protein MreD
VRDYVQAALGIGLAFGLYTILGRVASSSTQMLSIFTLTVVYFGMAKGELVGALTGTSSGLIVDAFSLGVFGVSGLTLTVTGYLAGLVARRINLLSFLKTFVFLIAMTLVESLLWLGLVTLILSQKAGRWQDILLVRPLVTAGVGAVVFSWIRRRRGRNGR